MVWRISIYLCFGSEGNIFSHLAGENVFRTRCLYAGSKIFEGLSRAHGTIEDFQIMTVLAVGTFSLEFYTYGIENPILPPRSFFSQKSIESVIHKECLINFCRDTD